MALRRVSLRRRAVVSRWCGGERRIHLHLRHAQRRHQATTSAAVLPGWRFAGNGFVVSVFAGAVVQDYRLSPFDPGARLQGLHVGGEFAADVWYQPTAYGMISVNGTFASVGPTGSLRVAFGSRLFDRMFVGPETEEIWCGNFEEYQFGAHVTALRTGVVEWSAGSGWAFTTDHRNGPYFRLGGNVRY